MKEIYEIDDRQLDIFCRMSEQDLAHIYEPEKGLFLAESEKVLGRALAAGYEPECALIEKKMFSRIEPMLSDFPYATFFTAEYDVLKNITGYHLTGGVLCTMKRKELPGVEDICQCRRADETRRQLNGENAGKERKRIVYLDGVVNPTNVGAIFRNAAALGMDGIILSSDSCDPLYKRSIRVSMGNVFQIPWTKLEDTEESWITSLKKQGFVFVATALDEKALSIKDESLKNIEKMVLCMGSEGYGMKADMLRQCEKTVYIPMYNEVDSLNVAAASALAFWELA